MSIAQEIGPAVLVVGGSHGLGLELALQFLNQEGYKKVLVTGTGEQPDFLPQAGLEYHQLNLSGITAEQITSFVTALPKELNLIAIAAGKPAAPGLGEIPTSDLLQLLREQEDIEANGPAALLNELAFRIRNNGFDSPIDIMFITSTTGTPKEGSAHLNARLSELAYALGKLARAGLAAAAAIARFGVGHQGKIFRRVVEYRVGGMLTKFWAGTTPPTGAMDPTLVAREIIRAWKEGVVRPNLAYAVFYIPREKVPTARIQA